MLRAEVEDVSWEFDCDFADLQCKTTEGIANSLADVFRWTLDISLGSQGFVPGDTLWNAATNEASSWFALAIVVMVIATVVGLTVSALRADRAGIIRTLVGMLTSIAATVFAVFVLGKGLEIADEISESTLDRLTHGENGFKAMVMNMMLPPEDFSDWAGGAVASSMMATPGVVILLLLLFIVGLMIMTVAVAFRNFILMILIAFAPLAFMILPHKGGEVWVKRWAAATVAMLLAKPLIFGALALLMGTMGEVKFGDGAVITVAIGTLIAGFMPLVAYSFFSFLGGSGSQIAGEQVGSQVSGKMQHGAQNLVSRFGRGGKGGGTGGGGGGSGGAPSVPPTPAPSTGTPQSTPASHSQPAPNNSQPGQTGNAPSPQSPDTPGGEPNRAPGSPGPTPPSQPGPTPQPRVPTPPTPQDGDNDRPRET